MKVSVVICTYSIDLYEHFQEAVESVLAQTYDDVELVLVSDGSEAVYERIIDDYSGDNVITHCNDENVGLLESRNRGVELANGDIVAFIDDDAIADPDWIEELMRGYTRQDALAVGGRMTPKWVAGKPTYLPEEYYWLVGVTHRGFADGPGWVRNTFGSNLSFRRDVFLDLGGFDTEMGGRKGEKNLQGGETELCARLTAACDEQIWYEPDAVVEHKVFEYRTDLTWLMSRAFWQGYSKRVMGRLLSESSRNETAFLKRLLQTFIPDRIRTLVRSPSVSKVLQLFAIVVFTTAVGFGYVYGTVAKATRERANESR